MFSKKATKFDKIFTFDLTLCSKCQIDDEDFFNFCDLLRKHELYFVCKVPEKQPKLSPQKVIPRYFFGDFYHANL